MRSVFFIATMLLPALLAAEPLVVTHSYSESYLENSVSAAYEVRVLELALEKTVSEFGDYEIHTLNKGYVTHPRAMRLMESNLIKNYVKVSGYNSHLLIQHNLDIIRFPVYMGLLGYRTCFVSESLRHQVAYSRIKEDLMEYKQGTGIGWADANILRHNGIKVEEIADKMGLYRMTAMGRIDLFCRGANEAYSDVEKHRNIPHLDYDSSFVIHYANPHLFHTHKANVELIERLEKGLHIAFYDGSLERLWLATFYQSIEFANIPARNMIYFDNPFVEELSFDYERYNKDLKKLDR